MAKAKGWHTTVECPYCRDKFKITQHKLFLDPSPRNDNILVPFAECPTCTCDIEIKGVPPEVLIMIQGII